ncbi:hypothetical protein E4U36_002799 [Claviceps purpurea]|nr:hypothetical protein E4U51_007487 [Claviceps purpurea]KAG6183250.1 hypothetical protein E4U36_002799 [Claviceps purpurea]
MLPIAGISITHLEASRPICFSLGSYSYCARVAALGLPPTSSLRLCVAKSHLFSPYKPRNRPNCKIIQPFSTFQSLKMASYIVTFKDDASEDQIKAAKKQAVEQGAKITHEYSLIKGFAVEINDDAISTLEANENIKAIEKDGQASTC